MSINQIHNPSGNRIKVLSVHHSTDFHKMIELILNSYTYQGNAIKLLNANDVGQAANFLRTEDIAIALIEVDSKMGKLKGLDLIGIVRNTVQNNDIRLIIVAGDCNEISKYKLVTNYDVNGFLEKSDINSENLFSELTIAIRGYERIVQIRENYERMKLLMDFTRKHTQYKGLEYIITAVYNFLCKDKYVESVAVFKNYQIYKSSVHESAFIEILKKWRAKNEEMIDSHFIIRVREFEDYLIIVKLMRQSESSIQYSKNLIDLATAARNNIVNIVKNDKLLLDLYYISANIPKVLYIKAYGRYSKLHKKGLEPETIHLSIKSINSFFEDCQLMQINRSVLVNNKMVKKVLRYSSRKVEIQLNNKMSFEVSRGNISKVTEHFQHLLN